MDFEIMDGLDIPTKPILMIACLRERNPPTTRRTFRVYCGNTIEVLITRANQIHKIGQIDDCREGKHCQHCQNKIDFIRNLVASGK